MCAPDVDTSRADANAAKMTELTEDQWNWVKTKFEESEPERASAAKRAGEVSDAQLRGMNLQTQLTEEGAQEYRSIYRPLERRAAEEAANFDTDAKQEELAGKAGADVAQAFGAAREGAKRDMARLSVDPADGAWRGTAANLEAGEALATAFAKNKARSDAETLGRALRSDVIATGRGVVGSQGTTAGLAINAGNSSVVNANVPNQITAGGVQMVSQGARDAVSGYGAGANVYTNSARLQQGEGNSGLASLAGSAMTAYAI